MDGEKKGTKPTGHPVIQASTVPCVPPETNHVGIVKRVHAAIFEILLKDHGVLVSDIVIKALKKQKHANG